MKNTKYLLSIIVSQFVFLSFAQIPSLEWGLNFGGPNIDHPNEITLDENGNIYVTGYFNGTVDFDPGIGVYPLQSAGRTDFFVQKLNSEGELLWAISGGGSEFDYGQFISLDTDGNVYITGGFQRIADFDPSSNTNNLTSKGNNDAFVLKLDENGNFIWVNQIGGTGIDFGYSLATDASNNVFVAGYFQGEVDFNPGTDTFNLNSVGLSNDIFIQKLNSNGDFVWAIQLGDTATDAAYGIDVDVFGDICVTGLFRGTIDFDPGVDTNYLTATAAERDIFILKLTNNGEFLWANRIGAETPEVVKEIKTDSKGNVYTIGHFNETVDFDPSDEEYLLTSNGKLDIYIQKLDRNGDFLWAKTFGSEDSDLGYAITFDKDDNVYTTGGFKYEVDFDPGLTELKRLSNGTNDVFLQKLDENGNYIWATSFGGTGDDAGLAIAIDKNENIYLSGYFESIVNIDLGIPPFDIIVNGLQDAFLIKLIPSIISSNNEVINHSLIDVYPNPTTNKVNFRLGELRDVSITIRNITGETVFQSELISSDNYLVDLNVQQGIYLVEVKGNNTFHQTKLVVGK